MKRNRRASDSGRLRGELLAWTAWALFLSLVAGLVACAVMLSGARAG